MQISTKELCNPTSVCRPSEQLSQNTWKKCLWEWNIFVSFNRTRCVRNVLKVISPTDSLRGTALHCICSLFSKSKEEDHRWKGHPVCPALCTTEETLGVHQIWVWVCYKNVTSFPHKAWILNLFSSCRCKLKSNLIVKAGQGLPCVLVGTMFWHLFPEALKPIASMTGKP